MFLSSSFSFLSSFFWQHFDGLYLRHAWCDFDETWAKVTGSAPIYVTWLLRGQRSRRGHGVKKSIFTKKVSTPQRYKVLSWNFGAWMVSTFSTKVMGWQKYVGSNGVTGVKIKGQIFNFVRFQRLRCQIVRLEPRIKCFNGNLFVRPFLKGSKIKERSNFQLCLISKVKVSKLLVLKSHIGRVRVTGVTLSLSS